MIKANSLRAKILENYDDHGFRRLSWRELAEKTGSKERYLARLSRQMAADGLLPETPESRALRLRKVLAGRKAHENRRAGTSTAGSSKKGYTGKLGGLASVLTLPGGMPREDRLRILAQIAETGPDIARIQAITKLEEFERAAGSSYGPPPPTTQEDTVALMVELLRSVNPDWAKEAIEAFNESSKPEAIPPPETSAKPSASDSDLGGRAEGP
jgi:hypothetical protein